MNALRRWLCLVLLACAGAVAATELEVVRLSHRTAEEITPLLSPHLGPDSSISGRGDTLILRAPPGQHPSLIALIRELDQPLRSLRISVRQEGQSSVAERGGWVDGRVGSQGAQARARVYSSRGAAGNDLSQQVRALEGRPAHFAIGLAVPVRDQAVWVGESAGYAEQTRFLELNKGFDAIAHVSGGQVRVDIASEYSTPERGGARRHQIVTSVSGRLGEWLPLGASGEQRQQREGGISYRSRDARSESRQVWVKVDLLD